MCRTTKEIVLIQQGLAKASEALEETWDKVRKAACRSGSQQHKLEEEQQALETLLMEQTRVSKRMCGRLSGTMDMIVALPCMSATRCKPAVCGHLSNNQSRTQCCMRASSATAGRWSEKNIKSGCKPHETCYSRRCNASKCSNHRSSNSWVKAWMHFCLLLGPLKGVNSTAQFSALGLQVHPLWSI